MRSSLRNESFSSKQKITRAAWAFSVAALLSACSPTVKVEAPDKPIVINLNVKIEQEVRIRVEKEVEDLFTSNPDIF
jgi:hypothetical protein